MHSLTRLPLAITASLLTLSSYSFASEQPNAATLVGKAYGGIHALHINTDNDRLFTADPQSDIDHASGVGIEAGYRASEHSEFRLSYSHFNLVADQEVFSGPSGSSTALDLLYFPTAQNFYIVAGANRLDIEEAKLSSNLGAGYRHYLNEKSALYVEGKSHYQFSNHHKDFTAQVGFVYFFGETQQQITRAKSKPAPVVQPIAAVEPLTKAVPVIAAAPIDTDQDGIIDSQDHCANTPSTDKVDAHGCTIFTEQNKGMRLQVNFGNNQSKVDAQYYDDIQVAADFLKQYSHASLIIKGHTSAQGNAAYNKKLSQKRANAIVNILINEFDIASDRLSAQGLGEEQLINQNNNAAAHAENRRIEAKVVIKEKVAVKR